MAKTGRPSIYSEELADEVCQELAGGKSLVAICKRDDMPSYTTVMKWLSQDTDGFALKYARAKEAQAEYLADEIISIADEKTNSSEEVQRNRLRVDARKWVAAKLKPKKYGDRIGHEISGPDRAPVKLSEANLDLDLARRIAWILDAPRRVALAQGKGITIDQQGNPNED